MKTSKGFAQIIYIVIIAALLAAVGYLVLKPKQIIAPEKNNQESEQKQGDNNQRQEQKQEVQQPEENVFTNTVFEMQFILPDGYFALSNSFGIDDASKASAFYFRKESSNYSKVPILDIATHMKLSAGQTLKEFAEVVYEMNKSKNQVTTDLQTANYGNIQSYEFGIKNAFNDPSGGQLLDSAGGKVVFLYRNGQLFEFLQTGADSGLEGILKSLDFN